MENNNHANQNVTASWMEQSPTLSDDLRRYTALLWYWAWLLILAVGVAGTTAFVVNKQTTPVYQAATAILINEAPSTRSNTYADLLTSERLAQTYAELLTKRPVLDGVIQRLGLDVDAKTLKRAIGVQPVRDTQLIEVQVKDTDPERAAQIANTIVLEFADQNKQMQANRYAASKNSLEAQLAQWDGRIQQISEDLAALGDDVENQIERDRLEITLTQYRQIYASLLMSFEQVRLSETQSTSNVVHAEEAIPPAAPIRPRTMQNTALAAVVGLMLAVGVVFLIEALDDSIKGQDDVIRHLGLPILGFVPRLEEDGVGPVVVVQPRTPAAEAFRSLRTNIQYAGVGKPIQSLLVTSPSPQDGKSTIAANLASVIAQSGRKVTLLDSDLRRPSLHRAFQMTNRIGLSSLFVRPASQFNGALQETKVTGLSLMTSGALPPNPAELVGSEKMTEILGRLDEQADIIIVDTPPVTAVTDATVLSPHVDGVLLVIRLGETKLGAAKQTVETLHRVGARVLGVVFNEVHKKRSRYYYYYKGYYAHNRYYYGEAAEKNGRKPSKRKNRRRVSAK